MGDRLKLAVAMPMPIVMVMLFFLVGYQGFGGQDHPSHAGGVFQGYPGHCCRVQDPFPFYVLAGAHNLAANGLELPEVAGIVFRGIATGDWNLACVRGTLISATFVFRDGTIRTVRGTETEPLGTLADRFGIPCVGGKRITNAPAFLAQRVLRAWVATQP